MILLINAFSAKRGGGITYINNFLENIPNNNKYKIIILKTRNQKFYKSNKKISFFNFSEIFSNPIIVYLWENLFLKQLIKKNKVSVYFSPGGTIPKTIKNLNIKKVTMFRNMIPFDKQLMKEWEFGYAKIRNIILSRVLRNSMENADKVIFISKFGKSIVEENINDIDKKSFLIYHGVNKKFFNDKKLNLNKFPLSKKLIKEKFIIYPSIIDVYKSQKEVVTAYMLVKKKMKNLPKLLLIGEEYGNYSKDLRNLIKDNKLDNEVIFTGPIKHELMPWLYRLSEFTIFASKSENCPNILLEAMASGSGILCSNSDPMPEFGNKAVEYFNPYKPKELAKKILMFLNNKTIVDSYKKKSKAEATKFSWKMTTIKTLKVLNEC